MLILIAASSAPLRHFVIMLLDYYHGRWPVHDVTLVIPFAAVSAAIVVGFLLLPVLWGLSAGKKRAVASAGAICVFLGLGLYIEMIATRLNVSIDIVTSRMMRPPQDFFRTVTYEMSIPWEVRVHYYIFSIILVLAVLNFLYSLANVLYGDRRPDIRAVVLHGAATVCYALAYFFVRAMQFKNLATMQLTGWSFFNAAVCFVFAAIAVGLYGSSYLRFEGVKRFVPSVLAVATVLALYAAQYIMLGGRFYLVHYNAAVTLLFRTMIIIIPGIAVYFLARQVTQKTT